MSLNKETLAAYEEARRTWPSISLAPQRFNDLIRDGAVTSDAVRQWAADLYLAWAAADGDTAALELIEERIIARLPARIRRLGAQPEDVPDVLQAIRERLFAGESPRIRAYNGTVPLEQWINVLAIRIAIDMHRKEAAGPRAEAAWLETQEPPPPDVAALIVSAEYKRELEAAIREQLALLPSRERAVLRMHVLEGISIEKIAVVYGVHRVTVARWVWTAGETLLDGLRRLFKHRFGIAPKELDSLARLARSKLSLSLRDVLVADGEG